LAEPVKVGKHTIGLFLVRGLIAKKEQHRSPWCV